MRGLILVAVLMVAGQAQADGMAVAKQHFDEGSKWYDLGDFAKAIVEYKAAYAAYPDAVFLYNIAQAARLDNDLSTALFFYRSFLRKSPEAANRREVEGRIRKLEVQLEQQKSLVTAPPNNTVAPGAMTGTEPTQPRVSATPEPTASVSSATRPPPPETATPSEPSAAPSLSPVTTTASTAERSAGVSVTSAPHPTKPPLYKRWQLWTGVGIAAVVLVGVGVGLGVGLSSTGAPSTHFGTMQVGF